MEALTGGFDAASAAHPAAPPINEIIQLAALDSPFFAATFFPRAARQRPPEAHLRMWNLLDNPHVRYGNLRCFRGAAKTTVCRIFTAKRVAYGLSKTILYIGASEAHAVRSIQWLKNQIDRNQFFASSFKLRRGSRWADDTIEIINEASGTPESIWIFGVGITGNIRGINFDDFRPDLIVVDDVVTDENALTEEARNKMADLLLGAVLNSLASPVEFPNAKMVMLQTPIHREDASSLAMNDQRFNTVVVPCWTEATMGLPLKDQKSAWPEMFPDEHLRAEKLAAIGRNKLSLFAREMECRIMLAENAAFRAQWLKYWSEEPRGGSRVLGIDPVPPPSERQIAKNLQGKDFEAHSVWGRHKGDYYLHEYVKSRDHTPEWSVTNALSMAHRHKVSAIVVESVAYQRTLKWMLEAKMKQVGVHFMVVPFNDKRAKFNRITDAYSGLASQGLIHVNPTLHGDFIQDFISYPGVDHDDLLDSGAIALSHLRAPLFELAGEVELSDNVPSVRARRGAP